MQIETERPESRPCPRGWLQCHLRQPGRVRQVEYLMFLSTEQEYEGVGPRERQIIELLLQGCDNSEIARDLKIAERTVKAHFNRLFLRFGIKGGIKRVKLATLFYRRQLWQERQQTVAGPNPIHANNSSFSG